MALASTTFGLSASPLQAISVSANGRYFVRAGGTPFTWQADTAWSIYNHATPADVAAVKGARVECRQLLPNRAARVLRNQTKGNDKLTKIGKIL